MGEYAVKMPVAFTAHGNPMNALGGTPFSAHLGEWGRALPRPRAILCVSAHWESRALAVTGATNPSTIHDFWGFPEELYRLRYPALGSPAVAAQVLRLLGAAGIACGADAQRGLDHGAWSPLLHLYPAADVPVVQLSLPIGQPLSSLVLIGRALSPLREEGVLLLGSGNLVHNLATADLNERELPLPPWASGFDAWVRDQLLAWDLDSLAHPERGPRGSHAHPTLEHYAPLLVCWGAAEPSPVLEFPFEGFEHGTISMRCVQLN